MGSISAVQNEVRRRLAPGYPLIFRKVVSLQLSTVSTRILVVTQTWRGDYGSIQFKSAIHCGVYHSCVVMSDGILENNDCLSLRETVNR